MEQEEINNMRNKMEAFGAGMLTGGTLTAVLIIIFRLVFTW